MINWLNNKFSKITGEFLSPAALGIGYFIYGGDGKAFIIGAILGWLSWLAIEITMSKMLPMNEMGNNKQEEKANE